MNWALAEYLKRKRVVPERPGYLNPELAALTGASAGSINAVMTALTWCADPSQAAVLRANGIEGENPLDENPVRDIWVTVGIDDLLPDKGGYQDPVNNEEPAAARMRLVDSVFARSAFKTSIAKIKTMASLPVF